MLATPDSNLASCTFSLCLFARTQIYNTTSPGQPKEREGCPVEGRGVRGKGGVSGGSEGCPGEGRVVRGKGGMSGCPGEAGATTVSEGREGVRGNDGNVIFYFLFF